MNYAEAKQAQELLLRVFSAKGTCGTMRYFIANGQPGCNSAENNRNGYPTERAALIARELYWKQHDSNAGMWKARGPIPSVWQ